MKKKYYLLLILLCIIPLKVKAVDTYIDNYFIEINLQDNGDALVKELFVYKGSFNGTFKNVNYNTFTNETTNFFINPDLYSPEDVNLVKIKEIPIDKMVDFNYLYKEGIDFVRNDEATIGSRGYFSVIKNHKEYTYKIFNPGREKGFYIEYLLKNVIINHNDVGELWINILKENYDAINHLEIVTNLPKNKQQLKGWAHGPLEGNVNIINNQKVSFIIDNLSKGASIDIRLAFDNNLKVKKTSNIIALDKIINYETNLAEIANQKREEARNYSLQRENTKKQKASIFNVLGIIWIIGLALLIKFIYKNYDKEYISEFKGKYFRDIPNDNNPAIVSYLIDKSINNKDLSASILNLICNNNIAFEKISKNDYLLKLVNNDNLSNIDKAIIAVLFNDKIEVTLTEFKKRAQNNYNYFLTDYNNWYEIALKEAKNKSFYEEKTSVKIYSIMYSIIGFLGIFFLNQYTNIILFVIVIILSFISLIYFSVYTRRTKEGNEEYLKWIGLKNFMNDFGKMDVKELPEVKIWEKYLVYAVTLGCAERLIKTMKIKIKDITYDNLDLISFDSRLLLITNMNSIVNTSVNSAISTAKSIAASQNSSGNGSGGGFSSGGFSGGGSNSTGHF